MTKLSISRAWDETKAVLARDGNLIAVIALALLVLPGTLGALVQPQPAEPGAVAQPGWWSLVSFLTLLVGIVGQLAIVRVALGDRQTVGEAIRHGVRRGPAFLFASLIWLLPFALVALPLAQQMQQNPTNPPPAAALGSLLLLPVFLFLVVRLLLTTPVAAAEPIGPVAILKRSWALTRGNFWRLFGALLIFALGALVLVYVAELVMGILTRLTVGEPEPMSVGALLVALVTQLVGAALTTVLMVLLTRIYLQRAGGTAEPATVPHAP